MFGDTMRDRIRRSAVYEMVDPFRQQIRLRRWERRGRPFPPPHLAKQAVVREYAQRYGTGTFVETGTNLGHMVNDVKDVFRRLITIEIDPSLFARAKRKFMRFPHVTVLQGDSSVVLPQIVADLNEPALFWLDAHDASPHLRPKFEPPIMNELDVVLSSPVAGHLVLIDDGWRFEKGDATYPSIAQLAQFAARRGAWSVDLMDDIIRVVPQS